MNGRSLGRAALLALFILLSVGPSAGRLAGQEAEGAFRTLGIGLRGVANVNRTDLHELWSPELGVELGVETEFYLGRVEAGLLYTRFDARQAPQPDFSTLYPFVGWGVSLPLPRGVVWSAGGRIGSYLFSFETSGPNLDEQELALGLVSTLSFPLGDAWTVDASLHYSQIFTHHRIRLLYLAAGVRRSFDLPGWVSGLLQ